MGDAVVKLVVEESDDDQLWKLPKAAWDWPREGILADQELFELPESTNAVRERAAKVGSCELQFSQRPHPRNAAWQIAPGVVEPVNLFPPMYNCSSLVSSHMPRGMKPVCHAVVQQEKLLQRRKISNAAWDVASDAVADCLKNLKPRQVADVIGKLAGDVIGAEADLLE